MIRKKNLLMSYAAGENFLTETFWVYVNSALKNSPDADVVLLTHDMPNNVREKLEDKEVEVVDIPEKDVMYIYRDRHLAFWNYLNDHGHKYKYVMICDCKDVVFQKSPAAWVTDWQARFENIKGNTDFLNRFVILVSEGFKMQASGFACIEHFEFQRDVQLPFLKSDKERYILNGGTMFGTSKEMQNLHFLIWITTMKSIGRITDQATLNWIMRYLDKDDTYCVTHPQHDHFCLTGEGVKEGAVEPIFKDGVIYSPDGMPYHLVHQWDRFDKEIVEEMLSKYGE